MSSLGKTLVVRAGIILYRYFSFLELCVNFENASFFQRIRPLRDLRKIKGTYLEVTSRDFYAQTNTSDYLQITLTDEEDILDGLQKLRIIYPNLMQLEYDNQRTRENQEILQVQAMEEKSELELFEEFYQLQNNQPMSEEQKEFTGRLMQKLKEEGQ